MLNKEQIRELAYIVKVDDVLPMDADRLECARVGGWNCVVGKGEFKAGDFAVYFEIDSKLPDTVPFNESNFLRSKNFKIKSQKIRGVVSQGLLMPISAFGWVEDCGVVVEKNGAQHRIDDETRFLTQRLEVTYAVAADNERKGNSPKVVAREVWWKRLFSRKKNDKKGWPAHIARKTDVERIQNMIYILNDKKSFVATEKVDGSSCSVMVEKKLFGRKKFYVCSRNVVFTKEEQKCFYDSNIYFEVYNKYNLKEKISNMVDDLGLKNLAIQMEVYGGKIQKRDYSTNEHKIAVFHILSDAIKFPMDKVAELCEKYDLPHVAIVDDNYILPDTLEELQDFVEGAPSEIDGKEREGIVFYDKETGQQYFKFVSPKYLLKFHS